MACWSNENAKSTGSSRCSGNSAFWIVSDASSSINALHKIRSFSRSPYAASSLGHPRYSWYCSYSCLTLNDSYWSCAVLSLLITTQLPNRNVLAFVQQICIKMINMDEENLYAMSSYPRVPGGSTTVAFYWRETWASQRKWGDWRFPSTAYYPPKNIICCWTNAPQMHLQHKPLVKTTW